MWVFVRGFPDRCLILAPRAPYPTDPSGYSWRPPGGEPGRPPTLEELRPSAEALVALADAFAAQHGIDARQFDAIGFSQGAALVNTLALLHPDRVGKLGILAGFVPAGANRWIQEQTLAGKPFFVAHGTVDERVDIEEARRSIRLLERAGALVTFCEDDVGHKVSARCLRALEAFFR